MLNFENGGRLVQELSELPNLKNAKSLFLDTETTSFNPKEKALKPYHGHRICGIGVTADEVKGAWYVPVRCHHDQWNLPVENVMKWVEDTVNSCTDWVNHNVKFDAHFLHQEGIEFECRLVDTNTLAKIIHSDRYSHALDILAADWLEQDISPYDNRLQAYLTGCKSKDYGDVPGDIIGEYGCQDVLTNRDLYNYMLRRRHEQTAGVWETEILLTPVLYDMEITGLGVDKVELAQREFVALHTLVMLEEELHKTTGIAIRPHTNADCFEVLCNQYGLPVLGRTDKNEPSFDKATLIQYLAHPVVRANETLCKIVEQIRAYRKLHTLNNFFLKPYQEHEVDGIMHPDYNQIVRTGRMSCRRPNSQQLSSQAKALIHPPAGYEMLSWDYDQIEFRIIVHYIKDVKAIAAYAENPDVDFHQWVADMCQIDRKPAKNINFAIAFGGGKAKVVSMLALDMSLVSHLAEKCEELCLNGTIKESQKDHVFQLLSNRRGEEVYREYHDTLPGIRRVTKQAANNVKSRGYVFNAYGRQRHLPERAAYRAFNTIVQSGAADVIKERTVAMAPRYNKYVRDLGIKFFASVHDETAMYAPIGLSQDMTVLKNLKATLEDTNFKFRVPLRISCGASTENWSIASGKAGAISVP